MAIATHTRQRVRVVSETLTIPLTLPNRARRSEADPETVDVELQGYLKDGSPPMRVVLAVYEAEAEYVENRPTEEETGKAATGDEPAVPGTLSPMRWFAKRERADMLYRRELLTATLEGLKREDADVLAADQALAEEILADLGWVTRRVGEEPDTTAAEEDADPEVPGEDGKSTGRPASPDSPRATRARTSRR